MRSSSRRAKNAVFFAKMTERDLKQEYPIDVGSGICMGVMGKAGEDIDAMGFLFVKPIRRSEMINVEYPTIALADTEVKMSDLKSLQYENSSNSEQTFEFEASEEITTKESWSVTSAIEFAFHTSVKAGIPQLVQAKAEWSLKMSVQGTYEMENTKKVTEKWTFPVKVPENSKVEAKLSIGRANIDLPYEAKLQITTTDGSVLTFKVHGVYNGVQYTKGIFSVKPLQ